MPLNLASNPAVLCAFWCLAVSTLSVVKAEDPYRFFDWNVTYGFIYPLGVRQQGILINGQFPGPDIHSVTNDNLIINVYNSLDEPFLLSCPSTGPPHYQSLPFGITCMSSSENRCCALKLFLNDSDWNGIQQRRNSYEDGVFGTTCPIPPGKNFTYILQVKDQIGSFYYFPSLGFHKAAGGFRRELESLVDHEFLCLLTILLVITPFSSETVVRMPADNSVTFVTNVFVWAFSDQTKSPLSLISLKTRSFKACPGPFNEKTRLESPTLDLEIEGLVGQRQEAPISLMESSSMVVDAMAIHLLLNKEKLTGCEYRMLGLQNSLNFRIQNHKMKLVEVEGTHTLQTTYSSLDVHVGQSYSVLFTADQPGQDYYIVVTSRFTAPVVLNTTGTLHYSNSAGPVSGPFPGGPTTQIDWSLNQARSIRTNLTASGPRPNPQGSYHYGMINTSRTIIVANSAGQVNGKQRYGVNSVSFVAPDTPMKLADYFKIQGVFKENSISDRPYGGRLYLDTSVLTLSYRSFVEIVFQNNENIVQSWHLDGYSFFVVGMDGGQWTTASRNQYNLRDGVSRCTVQVYPMAWTAIYIPLDNVGMWNLRTEFWARQYLGQQFYVRVYTDSTSLRDEYPIPKNALLCGRASGRHTRPL
ncbi:hypothetical protein OIU77_020273 [Salix suchowensis]|uniref:Uncharacterized protein n=1 Tax=Salix suchowensis TaxID=1278906 RepID=A0ABQ9CP33_9ROSI|nr:hypothetical protein OIU77_020273 [Salix suchowensis]